MRAELPDWNLGRSQAVSSRAASGRRSLMNAPMRFALALAASLAVLIAATLARAQSADPGKWGGDARALGAAIGSLYARPGSWLRQVPLDSAAEDLERRLPSLRYDQAVAGFSRLIALLHDGHSRLGIVDLPSHAAPALKNLPGPGFDTAYPVEFGVFADGVRI